MHILLGKCIQIFSPTVCPKINKDYMWKNMRKKETRNQQKGLIKCMHNLPKFFLIFRMPALILSYLSGTKTYHPRKFGLTTSIRCPECTIEKTKTTIKGNNILKQERMTITAPQLSHMGLHSPNRRKGKPLNHFLHFQILQSHAKDGELHCFDH